MNKTSRWVMAVAVLGVLVTAGAGVAWWSQQRGGTVGAAKAEGVKPASGEKGAEKGSEKPADKPLEFVAPELTRAQQVRLKDSILIAGPLVAPSSAVVRARAGGRLASLRIAEGDRVQAGQTVGQIELSDLGSRMAERSAQVDAAQAALAQAERTHAQNERLASQSFISGAALDGSRSAVQTARAQLEAAQASLATTRTVARDASVVMPIGGIVAKRQALPGEMVSPDQPLLSIVDLKRLELAGTVGTHEIARLSVNMPVEVRVEGHAAPVSGRLARIAPAAEPGTRAIGVTVTLDNPKEMFRAGQYATATVTLSDEVDRWVLPLAAVGSTSGQNHVWTLTEGRLQRRAVTLGRRDEVGGRVEVLDGLPPGSQVLAARFDNLREGAPAKVVAKKNSEGG